MASILLVGNWHDRLDVARRAFESAVPLISGVSITTEPANEELAAALRTWCEEFKLPCEIYPHPRESGAQIRTVMSTRGEAFAAAIGATHLLNLDADDVLKVEPGFKWPEELGDCYEMKHTDGRLEFSFRRVFRVGLGWTWGGYPLHEVPACAAVPDATVCPTLKGVIYERHTDGARESNEERYTRHAEILSEYLKTHPDDPRATFYLAQSYRSAGKITEAIDWYAKRVLLGGGEEVCVSALWRARLRVVRKDAWPQVQMDYLGAYGAGPHRAEALVDLADYYIKTQQFGTALVFAKQAYLLPKPERGLFVEIDTYEFRAAHLLSVAAWWVGGPELELGKHAALAACKARPEEALFHRNILHYLQKETPPQ